MPITERTLKQWRKDALRSEDKALETIALYEGTATGLAKAYEECQKRILRLTQELLDQHLLRK